MSAMSQRRKVGNTMLWLMLFCSFDTQQIGNKNSYFLRAKREGLEKGQLCKVKSYSHKSI